MMSYRVPDSYIEKSFLYLVACSLLFHVLLFVIVMNLPEKKKDRPASEPITVDLRDLPLPPAAPPRVEEKQGRSIPSRPGAPGPVVPRGAPPGHAPAPGIARPMPSPAPGPSPAAPTLPLGQGETPGVAAPRGSRSAGEGGAEDLRRPSTQRPTELARLFPRADKLAKLEDGYRRKYRAETEEGAVSFLNDEDILFGSFLRRFENAVYGVWRYPQEAVQLGVQGVTPVKITFNRSGDIAQIVLLESSGSTILDSEVLRTLRALGPMGALPKGYGKESFTLIAFFRYSIVNGAVRGSLH